MKKTKKKEAKEEIKAVKIEGVSGLEDLGTGIFPKEYFYEDDEYILGYDAFALEPGDDVFSEPEFYIDMTYDYDI
jgi:hypothetical protein